MMEKRNVLWAFQSPKWAEGFEIAHKTSWTAEDILEKVRKIETSYLVWERFLTIVTLIGFAIVVLGGVYGTIFALEGLFVALVGQMFRCHAIDRCSQKICMYHLLWDMRKREEEAVLNSEIQDL